MSVRYGHSDSTRIMKHPIGLLLTGVLLIAGCQPSKLVTQSLDYTESPVDVPNPDRGFYRPQSYVVPVEPQLAPDIPDLRATIVGTSVSVESRIVYMEFDLRNFSSNAPLNGLPLGEWSPEGAKAPDYGTTQPLTPAALRYVRDALQKVRDSEAVAIVKFSYDGRGYTYQNRGGYDRFLHDCEPGAPRGRVWYETGEVAASDRSGIPGHEEKNWVQYHLWQLGSIFSEYEDVIMVVKGGFFGPWGEMHSSSYAQTAEGYHWLLKALLAYVPPSRSILVHAGGVMAWHNVEYGTDYSFSKLMPAPEPGSPAGRFGMFNDSYSRGGQAYTDGGSLSEGYHLIGGDYDRNAALTWMRNQRNFYGGETVRLGNEPDSEYRLYPRFPNVPYEAAIARTSHLNTSYAADAYRLWGDFIYTEATVTAPFTPPHDGVTRTAIFDPVYDGKSGMEFMRDRLGYRFVLREAALSGSVKRDGTLRFAGKIQNVGFGDVINPKSVTLILKARDDGRMFTASTDLDPRDWTSDLDNRPGNTAAWRDLRFDIDLNDIGDVPPGAYDLYLKINDPKERSANRRGIRFANPDIWDAALGANRIGSTTIR